MEKLLYEPVDTHFKIYRYLWPSPLKWNAKDKRFISRPLSINEKIWVFLICLTDIVFIVVGYIVELIYHLYTASLDISVSQVIYISTFSCINVMLSSLRLAIIHNYRDYIGAFNSWKSIHSLHQNRKIPTVFL